jgi:hypothetical protein
VDTEQLSFWESSSPPKRRKAATSRKAVLPISDPEVSGIVGKEILGGRLDPAIWALALAQSDGSRDHALTCYARLRLESLEDECHGRRLKQEALEARRRAGFRENPLPPSCLETRFDITEIRPIKPKKAATGNRRRYRISLFWLVACALGISGASSAASRHFHSAFPELMDSFTLPASLAIGPLLAVFFAVLHFCTPSSRPTIRHVIPLTACGAACASLCFGLLLIKSGVERAYNPPPSPPPAKALPLALESRSQTNLAATQEMEPPP